MNYTRRISCDLSEGVGRDSTCIVVVDDWGLLDVVLGNGMGLPEAAEAIHRLAGKWNVPHDRISFDKLGIGRNFPNHLARWGITMAIPYAGEGRPRDAGSFVNLAASAAGSCTIGWTQPSCRSSRQPRAGRRNRCSSGRSTSAPAPTTPAWSRSCVP